MTKRLGISRNTVRRYLRGGITEPEYPARQTPSSLDRFAHKLSAWLKTESTKSRKQRRTLKQIHEDLRELGFEGSYDRMAAFARQWKMGQMERVNSASKGTHCYAGAGIATGKAVNINALVKVDGRFEDGKN